MPPLTVYDRYAVVGARTGERIYVPKDPHEKEMQRALIQYRDPKNYDLIKEALHKAGRTDLIGFDQKCLIKPRKMSKEKNEEKNSNRNRSQRRDGERFPKGASKGKRR